MIGRPPADITADPRTLAVKLRRISPVAFGISPARWANVKSLLLAALALVRPIMRGRSSVPISEAWSPLNARLNTRTDRIKLSRLLRWLSGHGIEPEMVTIETLNAFRTVLTEETLIGKPERTWTDIMRTWNRCAGRVQGWPQVRIPRRANPKAYTLPWSAFPPSLKHHVDAWPPRLSGVDFADDGPTRPLSEVSLKAQGFYLRAFASALVLRGRDAESLISIAACATMENFTEGLRYFHERFGEKPNPTVHRMATTMKALAKHWVKVEDDTLKRMAEITRRLAVSPTGMTGKNRERLQPFNDTEACQRLLGLPLRLRHEIERGMHSPYHAKTLGQIAVAIEILIFAPLRIKNLATLEIDRHLIKAGGKLLINVPAAELKTRRADLDFELPEESADLIRWYIRDIRRASPEDRHLFPGANGRHKSISTLRTQIKATVQKHTGLEVNPHLFRHIGAKLFLDANPGAYEVMRRVFGHSSIDATTRAYTGFETGAATRQFDATIAKLRIGTPVRERGRKVSGHRRHRDTGTDVR